MIEDFEKEHKGHQASLSSWDMPLGGWRLRGVCKTCSFVITKDVAKDETFHEWSERLDAKSIEGLRI